MELNWMETIGVARLQVYGDRAALRVERRIVLGERKNSAGCRLHAGHALECSVRRWIHAWFEDQSAPSRQWSNLETSTIPVNATSMLDFCLPIVWLGIGWGSRNNAMKNPARISSNWLKFQVKLNERLTSPPDHLTESELITLMEKHGIGTVF